MYLPKQDIYEILNRLPYSVSQASQNVFNELPAITFYVANNKVNLDLDKDINNQDIAIVIDFWSRESSQASNMLKEVEELMRGEGYKLTFSADVPNPDSNLFHITSRFEN